MTSLQNAEYLKGVEDARIMVEQMHSDRTDWKVSKTTVSSWKIIKIPINIIIC